MTTALKIGRSLLFLSDFDGTLTPIVRDPAEAWLPLRVREDLRTLAGSDRVIVGVVSGRRLDDLRRRVGLSSIIYAGCHGLEISGLGATFRHRSAAARTEGLADMADELRRRTARLAGVVVEPKGLSVAVHYRNAGSEILGPLSEMVGRVVSARPGYTLLSGRKVFEILPAGDWDKGRCVEWIEEQVRARGGSATTVYLGDDATDELAFAALHGRGITVKVGDGASTRAACRVQDVDEVHRVLAALADHVAAGTTP
ncbi:MAG TPA: trehalose-phosphatase [Methylomirabilota bacterium]|nr:trehalose-phosphatase [Methylomirabilota bacterium]